MRKFPWWQIAIATIGISALGAISGRSNGRSERKSFKEFKQAPWAPPPWVFAPAWTAINFSLLNALNRIANPDHPRRKSLLYLQLPIWVIYFTFGYVYAKKRSPWLAAGWTVTDTLAAGASFLLAAKQDKKTAQLFLPLVGWGTYASSLAIYQALKNEDPVLDLEPVS